MATFTDEALQIMADVFFKNNPDRSWVKLEGKFFDNNGELPEPSFGSAGFWEQEAARRLATIVRCHGVLGAFKAWEEGHINHIGLDAPSIIRKAVDMLEAALNETEGSDDN